MTTKSPFGLSRRSLLAGASLAILLATSPVVAQDASGELVIMQWQGGVEADLWKDLEAAFVAKNPGVTIRELVMTGQGDMRGPMRTALLGGEVVDIIINTWPAFRAELNDAGLLRPIDDQWTANDWSSKLNNSWKALGQIDGTTFGLTYTYGDRSGVWYKPAHMEKAGISAAHDLGRVPRELRQAQGRRLRDAGRDRRQVLVAHRVVRNACCCGPPASRPPAKLAAHEIPWTDPAVKGALQKYAEMLNAGCCGDPATMFANDWDGAADLLFKADAANYQLIGMWVNARARSDYGLTEGADYSLFQFPALGMGHDDTSSVDAKELNVTSNGANPAAADAFLDFVIRPRKRPTSSQGYGYASPSSEADPSLAWSGAAGRDRGRCQLKGAVRPRRPAAWRSRRRIPGPAAEVPAGSLRRQHRCGSRRDRSQGGGIRLMSESVADNATAPSARRSSQAGGERRKLLATRGWRLGDTPAAWLLILPVIVLFGISVVFPLIDTIRLSFFDIKGLAKPKYVGFGNYIKLFSDSGLPQHADHDADLHRLRRPSFRCRSAGFSRCSARSRPSRRRRSAS